LPPRRVFGWDTVVLSWQGDTSLIRGVIGGIFLALSVHADMDFFARLFFPVKLHEADKLLWMTVPVQVQVDAGIVVLRVSHGCKGAAVRQGHPDVRLCRLIHAHLASFSGDTTRRRYTVF